jgi:prepilin-type processing-associated H-X9-DG protein
LIELLVVIGIILLLCALLIPAVQRVRASALRVRCVNNLRQIGLGLHGYHDSQSALPRGIQDDLAAPYPLISWMACILPWIEQQPLWDQTEQAFRLDPLLTSNPPHIGESTRVPLYECPACTVPLLVRLSTGGTVALGNYRGVAGTNMTTEDGLLFRSSAVRLSDVSDGTSNTLMVGESLPLSEPAHAIGAWYNGVGLTSGKALFGAPEVVLGVREINPSSGRGGPLGDCGPGPYNFGPGKPGAPCDLFRFWSQHPSGANFLAADGSARFVTYSAEAVLPALATRAGGEVASMPDS